MEREYINGLPTWIGKYKIVIYSYLSRYGEKHNENIDKEETKLKIKQVYHTLKTDFVIHIKLQLIVKKIKILLCTVYVQGKSSWS